MALSVSPFWEEGENNSIGTNVTVLVWKSSTGEGDERELSGKDWTRRWPVCVNSLFCILCWNSGANTLPTALPKTPLTSTAALLLGDPQGSDRCSRRGQTRLAFLFAQCCWSPGLRSPWPEAPAPGPHPCPPESSATGQPLLLSVLNLWVLSASFVCSVSLPAPCNQLVGLPCLNRWGGFHFPIWTLAATNPILSKDLESNKRLCIPTLVKEQKMVKDHPKYGLPVCGTSEGASTRPP